MHVGIFGLSGSGKTTLRSLFCAKNPYYFGTSISELLKSAREPIDAMKLPEKQLERNQEVAKKEHLEITRKYKNTIVDMHALIETSEGVYWIPEETLAGFNIDLVFFILCDPDQLYIQRSLPGEKNRKSLSPETLSKLQINAINHLKKCFKNLHILDAKDKLEEMTSLIKNNE